MFITPFMAAVLVGTFWTGVGTAAIVNNGGMPPRAAVTISADVHVNACHARYHSYTEDTDMWLGHDGKWHVCQL